MGLIDSVNSVTSSLKSTKEQAELKRLQKQHEKELQDTATAILGATFEIELEEHGENFYLDLQGTELKTSILRRTAQRLSEKKYTYNNGKYYKYNFTDLKDRRFLIGIVTQLYDKTLKKTYKQFEIDYKIQERERKEQEQEEERKRQEREQQKQKLKQAGQAIGQVIITILKIIGAIGFVIMSIIVALAGSSRKKIR